MTAMVHPIRKTTQKRSHVRHSLRLLWASSCSGDIRVQAFNAASRGPHALNISAAI